MQPASGLVPWLVKISVYVSFNCGSCYRQILKIAAISQNKMGYLVVELELYLRVETQLLMSNITLTKVSSAVPLCLRSVILGKCSF